MTEVFVLQNQDQLFLSKQNEWIDGREPQQLYKTPHKDEALNQLIEVNSKDYMQRIQILGCPVNQKGIPELAEDILPPPIPKQNTLLTDDSDQVDDVDSIESIELSGTKQEGNSKEELLVD